MPLDSSAANSVASPPADIGEPVGPRSKPSRADAEAAVRTLIRWAGDDPDREGLRDTPQRVTRAYEELFSGYHGDPGVVLDRTFREVDGYEDVVLVRDIPFHSHCEHHMVPFRGVAHIAYVPDGQVVGLSKLARLLDIYARRLQTQEALTAQVARALETRLAPLAVAVIVEAEHLCMSMRGVRKERAVTVTRRLTGLFQTDADARARLFALLRPIGSST